MRPDSITVRPGPSRDGRGHFADLVRHLTPRRGGGLLFSELASRYLANRELIGLKRTTLMDYESYTRVHPVPASVPSSSRPSLSS